ncbi:MAG: hypothetical protein HC908_03510 [Calothrix sp. SM1_7_51]|nr:hypothetical protein [Calothrix sp. SM1_7_51]
MLLVVFLCMWPYAFSSSKYGPVVNLSQALRMSEHWIGGRHPFFDANPLMFWFLGQHSGILPPLMPPLIWLGLLFPWMINYPLRFPLINLINKKNLGLLGEIMIVSFTLYVIAHTILLKLFFPTRYTVHTLRIIMAIASGISVTNILYNFLSNYQNLRKIYLPILGIILTFILLFYPNFLNSYPKSDYRIGNHPVLYQFLQQQPENTLTATLSDEADNLPTFSKRATLIAREYALPFHLGYYSQIRQRAIDLIQAQYSQDLNLVKKIIQKYGIDFWLLESGTFKPEYLTNKKLAKQFSTSI